MPLRRQEETWLFAEINNSNPVQHTVLITHVVVAVDLVSLTFSNGGNAMERV